MLEWVFLALVGGVALASGSKRDSVIRSSRPLELGGTRENEYANEEDLQKALASWRLAWEPSIDRGRWIPKSVASRIFKTYDVPRLKRPLIVFSPIKDFGPDDLQKEFDTHNHAHLLAKRKDLKAFFDTVEKNPLTDEQILACICMDDAIQIVAAAGSGKTSTMVAKVGYAIREGIARPDQILLLAFNSDAAKELKVRVTDRLADVPEITDVTARTFHAFGVDVIAAATGEKPSLATWLEGGRDVEKIVEIIDQLCDADANFRNEWDLFRTVFGRDIGKWDEPPQPDAYHNGRRGFRTARGEIVKSREERLIADWLFYNSVEYDYERDYEHKTASRQFRQYRPDFYYPDAGMYHEHFALNAKGNPPPHFEPGYLDGVSWKRQLHAEMGTTLIETTSDQISRGQALPHLRSELESRGVEIRFDASRQAQGTQPVSNKELARTIRVFQQHVKGNGLSREQLRKLLIDRSAEGNAPRLAMFMSLYHRVADEWETQLKETNSIDFEDMLLLAVDHIESGRFTSPFSMVLSDEFQDSSRARIRLLKALKQANDDVHLCVVGDDWQGINRFAGADISVMNEFESIFDYATRLTLTTTFRCPPTICELSSSFIQANPTQIRKVVETTNSYDKTPVIALGFADMGNAENHLRDQLANMHQYARAGQISGTGGEKISVLLVGRYRRDRPPHLDVWKKQFGDYLSISFMTIHASKGLEADYVMLLNMVEGNHGFPSQIEDDPVLQLPMPTPDQFPMSEERRLFYVALTRAKRQIRIYTSLSSASRFLVELCERGALTIEAVDGEPLIACPVCKVGVIKLRSGDYGQFQSCSTWPKCEFKAEGVSNDGGEPPTVHRIKGTLRQGSACPICRKGTMKLVQGRRGHFLGCSEFPGCKTIARPPHG